MSKQVLRSGTSIGANIAEAQYAQSKADFLTKMHISLKEASETKFWLKLLHSTSYIDDPHISIMSDCDELIKILTSTCKTTKQQ
jgi:four helix bundle protein